MKTLLSDGFEVAVFQNRGVGNTPYTSLKFADLSCTEEVYRTLEFVKERAGPDADLVGVGLSMGANILLKTAGEMGSEFPLRAITAVNCPFDIWLAINLMRGTPYEKNLAKELVYQLITRDDKSMSEASRTQLDKMIAHYKLDVEKIARVQTWRDLDEHYTIKIHP